MYYDNFVLPFTIGINILIIYLIVRYTRWIRSFPKQDRKRIVKGMFSAKTLRAIKEVFLECLVHRKVYRTSPFLGYMHMCFGLGWFLLIVVGKIESTVYHTTAFNPPYFAIFSVFPPRQRDVSIQQCFCFHYGSDSVADSLRFAAGIYETIVFQSPGDEKNDQSPTVRFAYPNGVVADFPAPVFSGEFYQRYSRRRQFPHPYRRGFFFAVSSFGIPVLSGMVGVFFRFRFVFHSAPLFPLYAYPDRDGVYFSQELGDKTRHGV